MPLVRGLLGLLRRMSFSGSRRYWETRYAGDGTSGAGSYGKLAEFKADILNSFIKAHEIRSVIDFGCGDGNQLTLLDCADYIGLDISETAVKLCRKRFGADERKSFFLYDPDSFEDQRPRLKAELGLSLDVIYHLVEDGIFEQYMRRLFSAAERFVVIYSSDTDDNTHFQDPYLRHRRFSIWIQQNLSGWKLIDRIPNRYPYEGDCQGGSVSDFFIYEKI